MSITRNDTKAQLNYIWECLHAWREVMADHDRMDEVDDTVWDNVCNSMHWIAEDLDMDMSEGN